MCHIGTEGLEWRGATGGHGRAGVLASQVFLGIELMRGRCSDNRENRENGLKNSLSGKTLEILPKHSEFCWFKL